MAVVPLKLIVFDTTHPYHPRTNLPHKRSECQVIVCGAKTFRAHPVRMQQAATLLTRRGRSCFYRLPDGGISH